MWGLSVEEGERTAEGLLKGQHTVCFRQTGYGKI